MELFLKLLQVINTGIKLLSKSKLGRKVGELKTTKIVKSSFDIIILILFIALIFVLPAFLMWLILHDWTYSPFVSTIITLISLLLFQDFLFRNILPLKKIDEWGHWTRKYLTISSGVLYLFGVCFFGEMLFNSDGIVLPLTKFQNICISAITMFLGLIFMFAAGRKATKEDVIRRVHVALYFIFLLGILQLCIASLGLGIQIYYIDVPTITLRKMVESNTNYKYTPELFYKVLAWYVVSVVTTVVIKVKHILQADLNKLSIGLNSKFKVDIKQKNIGMFQKWFEGSIFFVAIADVLICTYYQQTLVGMIVLVALTVTLLVMDILKKSKTDYQIEVTPTDN